MDKLREKLAALKMINCDDCKHDCAPSHKAILCPTDLDQVIAIIEEEEND